MFPSDILQGIIVTPACTIHISLVLFLGGEILIQAKHINVFSTAVRSYMKVRASNSKCSLLKNVLLEKTFLRVFLF
jgi:hypothetical protein